MKTQESLLNALDTATAEFGANSPFVAKFRIIIGQHFPNIKDAAFRASSTSGLVPTGFGGRKPIVPKRQNISAQAQPANVAVKNSPKAEVIIPKSEEEIAADANEQKIGSEIDLQVLATKTEQELLDTLGRASIQDLAIRLGFAIDVKKSDMAYTSNFKKLLLKAVEIDD